MKLTERKVTNILAGILLVLTLYNLYLQRQYRISTEERIQEIRKSRDEWMETAMSFMESAKKSNKLLKSGRYN